MYDGKTILLYALANYVFLQYNAIMFIVAAANDPSNLSEPLRLFNSSSYFILLTFVIGLIILRGLYEARHSFRLKTVLHRGILSDCTWKYPELYSIAINSLIEEKGRYYNSYESFEPVVIIIDTDPFGRTLFYYNENPILSEHYLIISQKCNGDDSYYLSGKNVISAPREKNLSVFVSSITDNVASHEEIIGEIFSIFLEKTIEKFKKDNEWNNLLFQRKKPIRVDVIERNINNQKLDRVISFLYKVREKVVQYLQM
ncbi:MAG: hypothetical protein LBD23_03215 [Oscillospiraceae bacterium]|nr:hypothetical protein [Oscillospiraceae bacterium]